MHKFLEEVVLKFVSEDPLISQPIYYAFGLVVPWLMELQAQISSDHIVIAKNV